VRLESEGLRRSGSSSRDGRLLRRSGLQDALLHLSSERRELVRAVHGQTTHAERRRHQSSHRQITVSI